MIELEISSGSDNDKYNKHHKYSKVPNKRAPRLFFSKKKTEPLTIITKRSILDVAAALDPPLVITQIYLIRAQSEVSIQRL